MEGPSVSPKLIRRIKEAAGVRMGHEVEPMWDEASERWVIYSFSKDSGQIDFPWMVLENHDGSYRPLDDRVVREVREASPRTEKEWEKSRTHYTRRRAAWKKRMALETRYNMLKIAMQRLAVRAERSHKLEAMYQEVCEELDEYRKDVGDDVYQQAAEDIVKILRGHVAI